jgi:predicted branched-subunit amino acid permease
MTVTDSRTSAAVVASPARAGFDDALPFALALIPFGLAVGGASAAAGLSATTAAFGAVVLLAGAGQLAAVEVLGSGGGILSVVLIAGLVNLRFVFYGAGIAQWFTGLPLRQRLLLAFPIVDQTFILCQERFADQPDPDWRRRYYLTATGLLAGTFVASQVIAFQLGSGMPRGLGLHLAAPLAFAGLLANAMKGRTEIVAGAMAAALLVAGSGVLGPLALPVAVAAGVIVASAWGTVAASPAEEGP